MAESIEAAWAVVADINRRGGIRAHDNPHAPPYPPGYEGCQHCADLRALALAELESYVAEVDRVAEADVTAGNPLEGAHYRAMRRVAAKHRLRIKALGT